MLHPVAALAHAADGARLGFPHGIVVMFRPDDGVGNFVPGGVLNFGAGGFEAVAYRKVNAFFPVATDAGAGRGQVKSDGPVGVQVAASPVLFQQALGQFGDFL